MNTDNFFLDKKIKSGLSNLENGNLLIAENIFEELRTNKPAQVISLFFLGIINIKKKNKIKAINLFNKVLKIDSKHIDANLNLGLIYFDEKNFDKAKIFFCNVIELKKNHIMAHYHCGLIYFKNKNFKEAINSFNICLNIDNKFFYSFLNLGHIYLRIGKFREALSNYNKVLELDKNNISSKFNISWCNFALNNLDDAYKYYEFRREKLEPNKKLSNVINKFKSNEWNGENLENKKILIVSEQGLGDNIQFFRYLYKLQNRYNCEIIFYTYEKLKYLFRGSPFNIVSDIQNVKNIDFYQTLLSLPGIFYKLDKELPKKISYIKIDNQNNLKWKKKLNKFKKPIIALHWQGNIKYSFDELRSIKLSNFKEIIELEKYTFISLQKNDGVNQIKINNFESKIIDFSNEIDNGQNAFEDTISILNNIDTLITIDTAIAHLAATMDVKTYLLLNFSPDWRWHLELNNNFFYPNLNILKQSKLENWDDVFKELKKNLL